jgi:hypothetical protein
MSMSMLRRADVPMPSPGAVLDDSPLAGLWRNADDEAAAPAIRSVELIRAEGRAVHVRMLGVDDFAWGTTAVEQLFAGSPSATLVVGFTASFTASSGEELRRARVQANIKLGVLVVAAFMHFADGRPPTFTRDFLYRELG